MRRTIWGFTAFALVLIAINLSAQVAYYPPVPPYSNLTRPPVKDPKAVEAVRGAITALGGAAAIGQTRAWQLHGQYQRTTKSGNETGSITWEQSDSEFRVQTAGPSGTNVVVT